MSSTCSGQIPDLTQIIRKHFPRHRPRYVAVTLALRGRDVTVELRIPDASLHPEAGQAGSVTLSSVS